MMRETAESQLQPKENQTEAAVGNIKIIDQLTGANTAALFSHRIFYLYIYVKLAIINTHK